MMLLFNWLTHLLTEGKADSGFIEEGISLTVTKIASYKNVTLCLTYWWTEGRAIFLFIEELRF